MNKNLRTKCILIRLTPEEYESLKNNSSCCNSISQYIRTAIKVYSDNSIKNKLAAIDNLTTYCKQYHNILFHTAANLNQVIKRANELNHAGLLSASFINEHIMPDVKSCTSVIVQIRDMLNKIMKSLTRS